MSDESTEKDFNDAEPAKKTARKRPATKKTAKSAKAVTPEAEGKDSAPSAEETPAKAPDSTPKESPKTSDADARKEVAAEQGSKGNEERAPVITEPPGGDESGSGKRRRRRRRKSGGDEGESGESPSRRVSLDPKAVASKAWKIYKAEVAEEGLALIDDNDARERSRRSFRLAEIFLEEAARRQ